MRLIAILALFCSTANALTTEELSLYQYSPAPERQSILSCRTGNDGYPNALEIDGTQLVINASSVPFIASIAAGYAPMGAKDFVAYLTGSVYVNLSAGTNYIFLERNPFNGRIAIKTESVAAAEGYVTPTTCTNGQHFFNVNEMQMYYCTSSRWEKSYSIAIGSATSSGAYTYSMRSGTDSRISPPTLGAAYLADNQTFTGSNTFSLPIVGNITGNSATVTDGAYLSSTQTFSGINTFNGQTKIVGATTQTSSATFTSSVTASSFFGDGSHLTGLPTYGNVYLASTQTFTGTNTFQEISATTATFTLTLAGAETTPITLVNTSGTGQVSMAFKPKGATGVMAKLKSASAGTGYTNNFSIQTAVSGGGGAVADRLFIDSTGKIGIGTTAPTEKLDVYNGNIKTNYGVSATTGVFTSSVTASSFFGDGSNLTDVKPNYYYVDDSSTVIGSGAFGDLGDTALGYQANAYRTGVAIGHNAIGTSTGVAVGNSANGNNYGVAVGKLCVGASTGAAVGYGANANVSGVAIGYIANGSASGVAAGRAANARTGGTSIGYVSNGGTYGTAIGYLSNAATQGIAIGANAIAAGKGNIAIGTDANSATHAARLGTVTDSIQLGRNMGAAAIFENKAFRLWDGYAYINTISSYTILNGTMSVLGNAFSVGGSTFQVSGGRVGIGTGVPAEKLDIFNGNIKTNYGVIATTGTFGESLFSSGTITTKTDGRALYLGKYPPTGNFGFALENDDHLGRVIGFMPEGENDLVNIGVNSPNVGGSDYELGTGVQFQLDARGAYGIFKIYQQLWHGSGDYNEYPAFSISDAATANIGYGTAENDQTAILSIRGADTAEHPAQSSLPIAKFRTVDDSAYVLISSKAYIGVGIAPTAKIEVYNGNIKTNYGVSAATGTFTSFSTSGAISISTSTTSSDKLCFIGAVTSLPTTGYARGCLAYLTSDPTKLYLSTETVVGTQSWLAK